MHVFPDGQIYCAYLWVLKHRLSIKTQVNLVYIQPIYLNPQKSNTTTQGMISDQERWDEEGGWLWREKDHDNQEPGRSSSCCWSWFHGEEHMSGLGDSLCRWTNRTRGLVEVTVSWLTGVSLMQSMLKVKELVGEPVDRIPVDLILHISVM